MNNHHSESGNVLFYILIAVVLLAALSYAVSNSGRGSTDIINEERARLAASEIIEYADNISAAVTQLRLRGVQDNQLCFDDAQWGADDYDHAGCADTFNQIFNISGAGITWKEAPAEAMSKTTTPDNLWHIYGDNEIQGIAATNGDATSTELLLITNELSLEVCQQLNNFFGVTSASDAPPTDTDHGETRYIGTFTYTDTIGDEVSGAALAGENSACFRNTTDNSYTFYKVLIPR